MNRADYTNEWAIEEKSLALKSTVRIWILAAIVIPFFAFFEYSYSFSRFEDFLYIFLTVSAAMIIVVALHKQITLPPLIQTYGVSVILGGCFSYVSTKTDFNNIHNYLMGVSAITLVRGMLYFGRVKELIAVTIFNHVLAYTMLYFLREESILDIPQLSSTLFFGAIFMLFSFAAMNTRYNLTKENFFKSIDLKNSFDVIEEKNKSITESIAYAERIQYAILPAQQLINESLKENFILYKPKDVVSGDFYWYHDTGKLLILALVDCTGHGVPGAFMSVMGYNLLNQVVIEEENTKPDVILTKLDVLVRKSLKQNDEQSKSADGMDMTLCVIDKNLNTVDFSSANRSLVYIRNNEINELKGDKFPIGGKHFTEKIFTSQQVVAHKGDSFYLFSDGYGDQFGGPKGKKFSKRKLCESFLSIHQKPLSEQAQILSDVFADWKLNNEQVDDVTVIGFRL